MAEMVNEVVIVGETKLSEICWSEECVVILRPVRIGNRRHSCKSRNSSGEIHCLATASKHTPAISHNLGESDFRDQKKKSSNRLARDSDK